MSEHKNDPSDLYDEEFLRKKEEFYSNIENIEAASKYEISEDGSDFEELIDDFADSDLVTKLNSKKTKKEKKNRKSKKKKEQVIDTPESEYDIFDLVDEFGITEDKNTKKPKAKKEKKKNKKPSAAVQPSASQKPKEPLKPFVPHTPVEEIKADVYVKNEELYEQQSVDIDELLKNLGIPTAEEIAARDRLEEKDGGETAESSQTEEDVKVFEKKDKDEMIDISSVSEDGPDFENGERTEDSDENNAEGDGGTISFTLPEKKSEENTTGATRYFNLKSYIQSAGQNVQDGQKKKASFTQHFRFLKNKESDETILESAPTGKGKDSMMDSVRADEGEDIFTAVEKAQKKNKRKKLNTQHNIISLKDYDEKLKKRLSKGKLNIYLSAGAFLISLIFTFLPSFYEQGGALEVLFGSGGTVYGVADIIIFAVICLIYRKELILGFNNIRYFSPDKNSVTVILGIFVLLFDIIAMAFGTMGTDSVRPYTVCFAFAVLVRFIGDYTEDLTAQKSVKALSGKGEYEGVHYVSSRNDALAIAHGLSEKNVPTILYSAESRVDEGIREDRAPREDEEKFYSFTCIAVLVASFVAGIVLFVRNRDAVSFITALTACVSFCLPIMNELVSDGLFFDTGLRLSRKGAAVNDTESLEVISKAKAVSVDAREIFTCDVSSFRRVKGAFVSKSDAAVFVAAALKSGGSMVGDCFDDFVSGLGIELPEAEDLQYEEKLGFSCWIAERRVLVGNRQMLTEHSIEAPSAAEEKAYAGKKNVMYLALEGQLVASFLVKYKVMPSFKKTAATFDKTGLVLMVSSSEPCLDEENCACRLGIDVAAVKILSGKASVLINSYKKDADKGRATALISLKKENSLIDLVVSAHGLYHSDRLASNLLLAGQGAGLVLMFLSVILNMPLFFNPVTIIVLQCLWSFVSFTVADGNFREGVKRRIVKLIDEKGRKSK